MLGRGLESLIPPKNNSVSDSGSTRPVTPPSDGVIQANSAPSASPASEENKSNFGSQNSATFPQPAHNPNPLPVRPSWLDLPELPAEPETLELPAEPELPELPSSESELSELPSTSEEKDLSPALTEFELSSASENTKLSPSPDLPELPAEPETLELPAEPDTMKPQLVDNRKIDTKPFERVSPLFDTPDRAGDFLSRPHSFQDVPEKIAPLSTANQNVKKENYRDVEMEASSRGEDHIFNIEVDKIHPNPHQPRRSFDEEAIHDLASSIREFGILQPLVVRKIEKEVDTGTRVEYELIAGERRLLASKYLGLQFVPVIIKRVDEERERLEMAIIENLQRENLSAIEMARAFSRLQDEFRMTQREIATRLGKSREVVANTVRLLDLPQVVQDAISRGEISESHGRLLLGVPDPRAQETLFKDLVERHLTTRELKYRVESAAAATAQAGARRRGRPPLSETPASPELQALENKISSDLGAPVKIVSSVSGESGKITITFYSKEELESLLRRFGEDKI